MKNVYNVAVTLEKQVVVSLNSKAIVIDWPFKHIKRKIITIVIFNSLVEDHRSKSVWKIYDDGRAVKTSGEDRKVAMLYSNVLTFEFTPDGTNFTGSEGVDNGMYISFNSAYSEEYYSIHDTLEGAEDDYRENIKNEDVVSAGIAKIIKGTEPHWMGDK